MREVILMFALVAAFIVAAGEDYDEAVSQNADYCEMVQLYKDTQGESGWPAYQGEDQCR